MQLGFAFYTSTKSWIANSSKSCSFLLHVNWSKDSHVSVRSCHVHCPRHSEFHDFPMVACIVNWRVVTVNQPLQYKPWLIEILVRLWDPFDHKPNRYTRSIWSIMIYVNHDLLANILALRLSIIWQRER